jgi:ElaB/YqjD/DUF883 family membrane-anchored ribosome-binding protein
MHFCNFSGHGGRNAGGNAAEFSCIANPIFAQDTGAGAWSVHVERICASGTKTASLEFRGRMDAGHPPLLWYDWRSLTRLEPSMSEINKERFMSDIKTVLADAEDLLKQAASATGERASELRETALTRLKQAKEKAADAQVVVIEKGKKAARATDDFVHERPWASIGIAGGIGVVIGLLINRR